MIRSPLGFRINPSPALSLRDQLRKSATLGARGVVLDAVADLAPDRLSETGRRELRHLLRSLELALVALHLPTRRSFDSEQDLDDRLARADRAFALAYELGGRLVLARVGAMPVEKADPRREVFSRSLRELGRRAEHRGIRLAIETGTEPGAVLRTFLDELESPGLAASIDPGALLRMGHEPASVVAALHPWVAHAYATEAPSDTRVANPRGFGFAPGALDWESYLGSLEEVDYRGYLTIWPDPSGDQAAQFSATAERLKRF
jgi:sugar phosphate isomerase/epimerase